MRHVALPRFAGITLVAPRALIAICALGDFS
jgi:hypothetical protein